MNVFLFFLKFGVQTLDGKQKIHVKKIKVKKKVFKCINSYFIQSIPRNSCDSQH